MSKKFGFVLKVLLVVSTGVQHCTNNAFFYVNRMKHFVEELLWYLHF